VVQFHPSVFYPLLPPLTSFAASLTHHGITTTMMRATTNRARGSSAAWGVVL
jgi:hypothetical protein